MYADSRCQHDRLVRRPEGLYGLGDGIAYNVAPPNNRQLPYPNLDTGGGVADGLADWQQNQWMDGIIEMGYKMDTQGWLLGAAHFGTTFGGAPDCPVGLQAYLTSYYAAEQWTTWQYDINAGAAAANSWDDYLGGGFAPVIPVLGNVPKDGVQWNSSPVLVTVDQWVDPDNDNKWWDEETQTEWYDWSSQSILSGGHTVIGMGYAIGYDPDGDGAGFQAGNWLIAHDGWGSTATDVAVPWDGYFAGSLWWANTHVVPEPATLALLLVGGFVLLGRKRS